MKKVKVNKSACIGCGACISIDPDHFEFGDDGLSEAINQENLESANLVTAMESCPTNAISFEEDEASVSKEAQHNEESETGENTECECHNDCECQECSDECECNENCKCSHDTKCQDKCGCKETEE